jgi:hypothetical protein
MPEITATFSVGFFLLLFILTTFAGVTTILVVNLVSWLVSLHDAGERRYARHMVRREVEAVRRALQQTSITLRRMSR